MVALTDSGFDLDLRTAEDEMEWEGEPEEAISSDRIVLAVLDGTTPPEEWIETIEAGYVLMLAVEGDLNELAAGFARDIKALGGNLVRFRNFLVVAPAGVDVDTERL